MDKDIKKDGAKALTVVYTYGVFDLFHSGHVELLKEAKSLGDKLIVGIFTDEAATSFKREPIISLAHRMQVVAHNAFVDEVIVQDVLQPDGNILVIKPNILAKGPGAGWGEGDGPAPGAQAMEAVGGKVVKLSYHHGISTSEIIKKIQDARP